MPIPSYTALVTGANSGIGLELTRKLLAEGWQVIAVHRSGFSEDDLTIHQAIQSRQLRTYTVSNLADYDQLRQVLQMIKHHEQQIDVLFNNAGGTFAELDYSKQGREMHYELMTVVPYIILMELKDLLHNGHLHTVINTSSAAVKYTKAINNEILERPTIFRKLVGPYATSKLALSLWTQAAAPRLAKEGIMIRSVDPGSNNTLRKGKKSGLPWLVRPLMKFFFAPPTHGADQLYQGAVGEHSGKSGIFVSKGQIMEMKFQEQAPEILERINQIYEQEFLQ
ncbi:SDR family NAD(P)-dependent oxidoreductase [Paenibacillus sp. Z6-24]